jgi:hypothetical protein
MVENAPRDGWTPLTILPDRHVVDVPTPPGAPASFPYVQLTLRLSRPAPHIWAESFRSAFGIAGELPGVTGDLIEWTGMKAAAGAAMASTKAALDSANANFPRLLLLQERHQTKASEGAAAAKVETDELQKRLNSFEF